MGRKGVSKRKPAKIKSTAISHDASVIGTIAHGKSHQVVKAPGVDLEIAPVAPGGHIQAPGRKKKSKQR